MHRSAPRRTALQKSASATTPESGLAIWLLQAEPAQQSPLDRVLAEACRPAGTLLLQSSDPSDFEQNLFRVLEDEAAAQANALLVDAMSSLGLDGEELGEELRPGVREFLGSSAEDILLQNRRLMDATFSLIQQFHRTGGIRSAAPSLREEPSTIGQFLDLLDLPPIIYRLLVDATLGNFALMALVYAIQRRMRVADWLSVVGAARFVEGMKSTIRLLGSIPGAMVSRRLLPASERLDISALEREYDEGKLGLRLLALRDVEAGEGRFFPFGGPIDDD